MDWEYTETDLGDGNVEVVAYGQTFVERYLPDIPLALAKQAWVGANRFKRFTNQTSELESAVLEELRLAKTLILDNIDNLPTLAEAVAYVEGFLVPLVDVENLIDLYIMALYAKGFLTAQTYTAFRAWVLDVGAEQVRGL